MKEELCQACALHLLIDWLLNHMELTVLVANVLAVAELWLLTCYVHIRHTHSPIQARSQRGKRGEP